MIRCILTAAALAAALAVLPSDSSTPPGSTPAGT